LVLLFLLLIIPKMNNLQRYEKKPKKDKVFHLPFGIKKNAYLCTTFAAR